MSRPHFLLVSEFEGMRQFGVLLETPLLASKECNKQTHSANIVSLICIKRARGTPLASVQIDAELPIPSVLLRICERYSLHSTYRDQPGLGVPLYAW